MELSFVCLCLWALQNCHYQEPFFMMCSAGTLTLYETWTQFSQGLAHGVLPALGYILLWGLWSEWNRHRGFCTGVTFLWSSVSVVSLMLGQSIPTGIASVDTMSILNSSFLLPFLSVLLRWHLLAMRITASSLCSLLSDFNTPITLSFPCFSLLSSWYHFLLSFSSAFSSCLQSCLYFFSHNPAPSVSTSQGSAMFRKPGDMTQLELWELGSRSPSVDDS